MRAVQADVNTADKRKDRSRIYHFIDNHFTANGNQVLSYFYEFVYGLSQNVSLSKLYVTLCVT